MSMLSQNNLFLNLNVKFLSIMLRESKSPGKIFIRLTKEMEGISNFLTQISISSLWIFKSKLDLNSKAKAMVLKSVKIFFIKITVKTKAIGEIFLFLCLNFDIRLCLMLKLLSDLKNMLKSMFLKSKYQLNYMI